MSYGGEFRDAEVIWRNGQPYLKYSDSWYAKMEPDGSTSKGNYRWKLANSDGPLAIWQRENAAK